MKKTIFWDYNGTIIDDTLYCLSIENEMLENRGLPGPVTLEEYLDHFGFPVINYYYKIGYTFEDETYEDVSVEFNRKYDENFDRVSLMDDFTEFIQKASEQGYQNVIVSASRQDKLEAQCEKLGIRQYFTEDRRASWRERV